jgi:hypothetical protein
MGFGGKYISLNCKKLKEAGENFVTKALIIFKTE